MIKLKSTVFKILTALLLISVIMLAASTILHSLFPMRYDNLINKYCNMYDVDADLVYALIKAESNFDEDAVSNASAKGIMQLTDETFLYCTQKMEFPYENADIFNPEQNIRAGVWYLSTLIDKYDGNTRNAIAAYNAGSSNVDNWLDSDRYSSDGKNLDKIPFRETARHIEKIDNYKKIYGLIY